MKNTVIEELIDLGVVKTGEFKLKSGILSPIYIDLRMIISRPQLLVNISKVIEEKVADLEYDLVAGIPYTALPMASIFSVQTNLPMIYSRKEVKDYGTKNLIEGIFKEKDKVLIIDDLITDGASKFETFEKFENQGLVVEDVVVLIDREQGGKENLAAKNYTLHSVISIYEIIDRMKEKKLFDNSVYQEIKSFLSNHQLK